jgi:hypothetical protein
MWVRKSLRLRGHDYRAPGAYYVTICVEGRLPLFGSVGDSGMVLNSAGDAGASPLRSCTNVCVNGWRLWWMKTPGFAVES